MEYQVDSSQSQEIRLTLEVVPENPKDADAALVNAVGGDTAEALRTEGATITPIYTGQRGGEFLVNVVWPTLTTLWAGKEVILADMSALVTIFTPVVLIAKHLHEAHEKDSAHQASLTLKTEIDGASISIEASDLETAETALTLAQRFQAQHPAVAANVTRKSHVKVTGNVSKRPRPKRR